MAGSTFGIIMIVIAAVVGLVVLEVLVLAAAERPYFKHSHPDRMHSNVRGGVHLGDPRSLGAPQDEPVWEAVKEQAHVYPAGGDGDREVAAPASRAGR